MRKTVTFTMAVLLTAIGFFLYNGIFEKTVHITAAGDILLDRGVRPVIGKMGYDYPYSAVKKVLRKGDITTANLECPLTQRTKAVLKMDPRLIFKGDPENAAALKRAGFNLLNLANNHAMDYYRQGLMDTVGLLPAAGIKTLGAGPNREAARKPVYQDVKGIRFGFLGFSCFPPEGYIQDEMKADVARIDTTQIKQEIQSARQNCDFLVVQLHWGNEFEHYPSRFQQELGRAVIDNGADLVIGHHPHVLQSVETYKGKLIFYSLGNFVFDRQIPEGTDEALLVDVAVKEGQWIESRVYPLKIKDCRPIPAIGEEAEEIIQRLNRYSKEKGTVFSFDKEKNYASLKND